MMNLRIKTLLMISLILISSLLSGCSLLRGIIPSLPNKGASPVYVPDDYSTIQAAVDAASSGDNIIVKDGTYYENVDVNKSLTIRSENGAEATIVRPADPSWYIFHITADFVTLNGFTVEKAISATSILIESADFCNISNNTITDSGHGLYLLSSNDTIICNNKISNCPVGNIYLVYASNNLITQNEISFSSSDGVFIDHDSDGNTIDKNNISNNRFGINLDGYWLSTTPSHNTIFLNNFRNNSIADVHIYYGSSQIDNILNSRQQITYIYKGKTYTSYLGNYWSDYAGSDLNEDGIGDVAHVSTPAWSKYIIDNYPLMEPFENYEIGFDTTPPPPSNLKATAISSSQITLSWTDNSTNEKGFKIERKIGAGSYAEIATVAANVINYTDSGLAANTTYTYRVRAYNDVGNSTYSNEASAFTIVENQPPVADAGPNQAVYSGDTVLFDGSNSFSPDGTIVSYEWDFGDGETATGQQVTHRFRGAMGEAKEYTVELTIEDDKEATNSDTLIVTVYRLIRYTTVYSSLCQSLPSPVPPIMEVVVYYNWVDEKNGQDEYIVSEVHLGSETSLNFALYMFSIKDEGEKVWSKIHKGIGEEDVSFTYPFGVPRDCVKSIGDEHFEGLTLGPNGKLNFVVYGVELGPKLVPSFFRVSHTIELGPGKQTELPPICPEGTPGIVAAVASPVELRVYDSQGRVTGLVNGEVKEEIPNSYYYNHTVAIFYPSDSYHYEVVGTDEGTYGLEVNFVENGETIIFSATDIPITTGAVHQYTIDWETLSQGGEGVTVQIDFDGDGTPELTITAGSTFIFIPAAIDIDPDTLNLKSKIKWVTAYIKLPGGYDVANIDVGTVKLWYEGNNVPAEWGDIQNGTLMVKFSGKAVQNLFTVPVDAATLVVTGVVQDGTPFRGNDTIRVIKKP